MALTDVKIRNSKGAEKPFKMADERGLYLLVTPQGGKLWRLKYRFSGTERKLALGAYPAVGLKEAREKREEARGQLASGKDPSQVRQAAKAAATLSAASNFRALGEEYVAKTEREGRAAATVAKSRWILDLLTPALGHRPVSEIEPHELLAVLKRMEARSNFETAKRTRAFASRVFRYAVATARAKADPAAILQGALTAPVRKHHAAILDPLRVGELLRAIDGYIGQSTTKLALQLAPHVFVRPGELRRAEWSEIDLNSGVWRICASKMKGRVEHAVPLSTQSRRILERARDLKGTGRYVFPSLRTHREPMSENTINAALRRLGFAGDEMTGHGFRAMASTYLNESGLWSSDAIERSLAHQDRDAVRAAYHRGQHWNERVAMAQWWSDLVGELRAAAINPG